MTVASQVSARLARAEIIAVGTELVSSPKPETNSIVITQALNSIGIDVVAKSVVHDDEGDLARLFSQVLERSDVVVVTGGLGPTDDDLTRAAVARALGLPLEEDPALVAGLEARFARLSRSMPVINRRQAQVPRGADVLENGNGSAPGLWIEVGPKVVVLLPGPPREMTPMLRGLVVPRLQSRTGGATIVRRIVSTAGRGESWVEEQVRDLYPVWLARRPAVSTTILASLGQVDLHLSARGGTPASLDAALQVAVDEVCARLALDVVSTSGESIEQVVGALLVAARWRVGFAESCTGGLATARLVNVPGSSAYVDRSVIVYSNEAKVAELGVSADLLRAHGAVSDPVARAMAEGLQRRSGVDVAVAVTGIAGPDGGTEEKPVGTVFLACVAPGVEQVRALRLPGTRDQIRGMSALMAIDLLRRVLMSRP